jgi:hypothetical protein
MAFSYQLSAGCMRVIPAPCIFFLPLKNSNTPFSALRNLTASPLLQASSNMFLFFIFFGFRPKHKKSLYALQA